MLFRTTEIDIPFEKEYYLVRIRPGTPDGVKLDTAEEARFKELLKSLSIKELMCLWYNPDLGEAIGRIAAMSFPTLCQILRDKFHFNMFNCASGDVWLDLDQLKDRRPTWLGFTHAGFYVSVIDKELDTWARNFILQEIRVNIWLRYIENKKRLKAEKEKAEEEQEEALISSGMLFGGYL